MALIHYEVVKTRPTGPFDYSPLDAEITLKLFERMRETAEEMRVQGIRIDLSALERLSWE